MLAQDGTIEAETLFMEPMGADTLGWFHFGEHRLSARLIRKWRAGCLVGSGCNCSRITSRYSIRRPRQGCSALGLAAEWADHRGAG